MCLLISAFLPHRLCVFVFVTNIHSYCNTSIQYIRTYIHMRIHTYIQTCIVCIHTHFDILGFPATLYVCVCVCVYCVTYIHAYMQFIQTVHMYVCMCCRIACTGWRRPIGCLKLQVIFRKKAKIIRLFGRK